MVAFAIPDDVEAIWRPLSELETARAAQLLEYASALIRQRVPRVDEWVADGSLAEFSVRYVAVQMVYRFMLNPEGKRQESIDDYSWTRDNALSAGGLLLADDLMAWLTPVASVPSGAFTIRPGASGVC